MTDITSAPEAPENDTKDPQAEQVSNPPERTAEEPQEAPANGNKEAAKYRRQLRDAEKERDTLAEKVASYERAEVERLAGKHLAKPAAVWAGGVTLDQFRDNDGSISAEKVAEIAENVRDEYGAAQPARGLILPDQGTTPKNLPNFDTWEGAFGPQGR